MHDTGMKAFVVHLFDCTSF